MHSENKPNSTKPTDWLADKQSSRNMGLVVRVTEIETGETLAIRFRDIDAVATFITLMYPGITRACPFVHDQFPKST